jgi:hypothetical protein
MRTLRYLNGVLTVIAVLLTLNVWTMWQTAGQSNPRPSLTEPAHAVGRTNAGQQREKIIGQLKQANAQLGELHAMLAEGKLTVQVKGRQSNGQ